MINLRRQVSGLISIILSFYDTDDKEREDASLKKPGTKFEFPMEKHAELCDNKERNKKEKGSKKEWEREEKISCW